MNFFTPPKRSTTPSEVVNDPDLTLNEKRAILASWASDACAVEAAPALSDRAQKHPLRFDDIMEALRSLDKQANGLTLSERLPDALEISAEPLAG